MTGTGLLSPSLSISLSLFSSALFDTVFQKKHSPPPPRSVTPGWLDQKSSCKSRQGQIERTRAPILFLSSSLPRFLSLPLAAVV